MRSVLVWAERRGRETPEWRKVIASRTDSEGYASFSIPDPLPHAPGDGPWAFRAEVDGGMDTRMTVNDAPLRGTTYVIDIGACSVATVRLTDASGNILTGPGNVYFRVSDTVYLARAEGGVATWVHDFDGLEAVIYGFLDDKSYGVMPASGLSTEVSSATLELVLSPQPSVTFIPLHEGHALPEGAVLQVALGHSERSWSTGRTRTATTDHHKVTVPPGGEVRAHFSALLEERLSDKFIEVSYTDAHDDLFIGRRTLPVSGHEVTTLMLGEIVLSDQSGVPLLSGICTVGGEVPTTPPSILVRPRDQDEVLPTRLEWRPSGPNGFVVRGPADSPEVLRLTCWHEDSPELLELEVKRGQDLSLRLAGGRVVRVLLDISREDLGDVYLRVVAPGGQRGRSLDLGSSSVTLRGLPVEGASVQVLIRRLGVVVAEQRVTAHDDLVRLDVSQRVRRYRLRILGPDWEEARATLGSKELQLRFDGPFMGGWPVGPTGELAPLFPSDVTHVQVSLVGYAPATLSLESDWAEDRHDVVLTPRQD